jgi:hypothetical protein
METGTEVNEMVGVPDGTNPDQVVDYVQAERLKMLSSTTKSEVDLKLKLLDSLSSTALKQKQISTEENSNKLDRMLIQTLSSYVKPTDNLFTAPRTDAVQVPLPDVVALPGETDIGVAADLNIADFVTTE